MEPSSGAGQTNRRCHLKVLMMLVSPAVLLERELSQLLIALGGVSKYTFIATIRWQVAGLEMYWAISTAYHSIGQLADW